ncbi:MAG: chemotaxis protein CheW [Proteobacteria bacterium]|nr:chemotaxis protein CheW [Pseudomonadota bacterium]
MSAERVRPEADRLLTFDVGGCVYALPIAGVLEVAEAAPMTCVPTLPRRCGGVMNWHGDALPVINPALLFDGVGTTLDAAEYVLVVSDRGDENARLGFPVDRVLGLVDGLPGSLSRAEAPAELVVERRPVEGRIVNVLDTRALVARAQRVIEDAVESSS